MISTESFAEVLMEATGQVSRWQEKRNDYKKVWKDGQAEKFDRVCSEEVAKVLQRNMREAEDLREGLASAVRILER